LTYSRAMTDQHVEVAVENGIGWLWLNRPEKLNALSEDMWEDIPAAVAALDRNPDVRVIVVAGRGPAFTVGIDIGMLASLNADGPSEAARNQATYLKVKELQGTFSCLAESPVPVIAAIHGYCLGGGIDLITACDIRLASADAVFSIRETRMGIVADVGTLQRLPHIISPAHVAELAYTGADIDAARAAEIGLLNHVYEDAAAVWAAAGELAATIAANSPLVVKGIKSVLRAGRDKSEADALDYAALWNAAFIRSSDITEAMSAFFEKRPPKYTGT